MSVQPGEVLGGKYRVERVLGRGGMGELVVATHIGFDDRVAIKVLLPEIAENAEVVTRFLREGRASRKIHSEHVVRVSDVGMLDNGTPYLVMELLDGCDLSQLVARRGPLPIADAVEYVLQACEAIAEAHALRMVHRDLKPANLFLTQRRDRTPCVKVLDFGISKHGPASATGASSIEGLTKSTSMIGSPLYMSPEQLRSAHDVDGRADIWALGIILYELLGGAQPFRGDTLPQLAIAITTQPPRPLAWLRPDVPPQLAAVIERCLAKDREQRFRNVAALARALAPFAPPRARLSIDRIVRVSDSPSWHESPAIAFEETAEETALPLALVRRSPAQASALRAGFSTTTGASVFADPMVAASQAETQRRAPRWPRLPWILLSAAVAILGGVLAALAFDWRLPNQRSRARDEDLSQSSQTLPASSTSPASPASSASPAPASEGSPALSTASVDLAPSTTTLATAQSAPSTAPRKKAPSPNPSTKPAPSASASTSAASASTSAASASTSAASASTGAASASTGAASASTGAASASTSASPATSISPSTGGSIPNAPPGLDCAPPYFVDDAGIKHAKQGCEQ